MPAIVVSTEIRAPLARVWAHASDLSSHAEWMTDAESIEFEPGPRTGVGTTMRVSTRVGPLRTVDILEVVDWVDAERISVIHQGIVSGQGSFELSDAGDRVRFTWTEELTFPRSLGGRVTATLARPVLRWIWHRNLKRFRQRVEQATDL